MHTRKHTTITGLWSLRAKHNPLDRDDIPSCIKRLTLSVQYSAFIGPAHQNEYLNMHQLYTPLLAFGIYASPVLHNRLLDRTVKTPSLRKMSRRRSKRFDKLLKEKGLLRRQVTKLGYSRKNEKQYKEVHHSDRFHRCLPKNETNCKDVIKRITH